jgi:hypothetical protein
MGCVRDAGLRTAFLWKLVHFRWAGASVIPAKSGLFRPKEAATCALSS